MNSFFLIVQRSVCDKPNIQAVHQGQETDQPQQKSGWFRDHPTGVHPSYGPRENKASEAKHHHLEPGGLRCFPSIHRWCNPHLAEGVIEPCQIDEHQSHEADGTACEG